MKHTKGQRAPVIPGGPIHASAPLPCLKVKHESERAARLAMDSAGMRAYRCNLCSGWHITNNRPRRRRRTETL